MAREYLLEFGELRIVIRDRFARVPLWQVQVREEPVASGIGLDSLKENGLEIVERLEEHNQTESAGALRRLILEMSR